MVRFNFGENFKKSNIKSIIITIAIISALTIPIFIFLVPFIMKLISGGKTYSCSADNRCIVDPDGTFDDSECAPGCSQAPAPATGYSCTLDGVCIVDPKGTYTEPTCSQDCAPPNRETYDNRLCNSFEENICWDTGLRPLDPTSLIDLNGPPGSDQYINNINAKECLVKCTRAARGYVPGACDGDGDQCTTCFYQKNNDGTGAGCFAGVDSQFSCKFRSANCHSSSLEPLQSTANFAGTYSMAVMWPSFPSEVCPT